MAATPAHRAPKAFNLLDIPQDARLPRGMNRGEPSSFRGIGAPASHEMLLARSQYQAAVKLAPAAPISIARVIQGTAAMRGQCLV